MTDQSDAPDPLDHDEDGKKGGAKAPAAQWVVHRRRGLEFLPPAQAHAAVRAGARPATERDLAIAGVDPEAEEA